MPSKRYQKAAGLVDRTKKHSLDEAVDLLQGFPKAKFDETVELSGSLSADPKKSDQAIRGTVKLPHGTGKKQTVLVFCKGEDEAKAKEAGADFVGNNDLIAKINEGWTGFDVVIATPDMMREVSRLGRILGPRGLMPSPKAGTVAQDVTKAIQEVREGRVEFKMDKLGNLHVAIGKKSFEAVKLIENGKAVMSAVLHAKPPAVKGKLIKRLSLSSTMSPGVWLDVDQIESEI